LWGKEAGWAHSVLFAADLKTFSERLTTKLEVDIDEVKIKQEDGTILESRVVVKREYALDVVKDEFEEEKPAKVMVESFRTQRAKRRRMG
jgi:N-glycosylase/DNA lyase